MGQRQIGLTGGIGMGKTTVSNYLASHYGLPVLDADIYAREAVAAGSPILQRIIARYGNAVLSDDSTLDRTRLGQIVFTNPHERVWLEQQIHPYVRDRFANTLASLTAAPTVVLAIPLLFEAGLTDLVTESWLVVCSPEQQIQRLLARGLSLDQAEARIQSQWAIADKYTYATVILDNSGSLENLYQQVDRALAGTV